MKGGPAGFARGRAGVNLADDGDGTLLSYTVEASIGGKLAQVGSRLIDSAARKMADDFFARFSEEMGGGAPPEGATGPSVGATGPSVGATGPAVGATGPSVGATSRSRSSNTPDTYESKGNWMIWAVVFAVLVLALVFAL